ncbi:MAG: carboxypeptidase regulatory-like domain-containing protein, partial [Gemmatimonadetes bacterium]|nr:carboxypeptidase regulatory-like domain-containing protein [Gemmatimonadota bacterium]
MKTPWFGRWGRAAWAACMLALGGVTAAAAQRTTSSIRGKVTDQAGAPVAGATVAAQNTATGFRQQASTRPDGSYVLPALPPGTYDFSVGAMGQATQTRRLEVLVAQDVTLNLQMTGQAVQLQGLVASATRAPEVRTSEVATNVTRQDIQNLPVRDRNFLALASMAPGFTNNPPGNAAVQPAAGALPAQNINVFVDGASLKSDVLPGGVAGQDASQGNPFPQNAVQEFRVITQNFKAEYQKASSAIITAVTRTGGNRWDGNFFVYGQPHSFVTATPFQDT